MLTAALVILLQLLDEAAANEALPARIVGTEGTELGRITKSIVLASESKGAGNSCQSTVQWQWRFCFTKNAGKEGGRSVDKSIGRCKEMGGGCCGL